MDAALSNLAVQSLNVGVAVLDSDTCVVLFNQWLVRASGLTATDVEGRPLSSLFPEWGKGRLAQALRSALTLGQPVILSHALNRAPLPLHWDPKARLEGHRMAQAVQLLPLSVEGKRYCSLQVVDVSAAVVREQRLHELATQARDARNAQREFLARMSHEIRTPMNGVIALCELLLLSHLDGEQRETLDIIHSSSHSLLSIINDVLDFSKIDAGKMTITKSACDVRRTIRDVVAVLGARAAEKHIHLQVRVDDAVPAVVGLDELRTRQILLNLVGNAIKFTDAHGRVDVGARWLAEAGASGNLTLAVKDTGIGIADSQQLFQVYGQADPTISKRFGGTGLGLAISKQLVELMGGAIGVQSVLGQGSTFWFTLPAEVTQVAASEPEPMSTTVVRSSGRVLVVDDNRVNQLVATKILTQMGYQVATADNGQLAIDAVINGCYDVVFMDCQMPVMDGYQATRELRAMGYTQLPIIAVTAGAVEGEREVCLKAGMTNYLAKPLTLKAVSDMMAGLRSSAA